jgi:hypothetical protein
MSVVEVLTGCYRFNRSRTLGLLDLIEKESDPQAVLGWRPGPGRAHIGWQLMHIGVTEEIFATERLAPHKPGKWTELWPRFRGGSTPDDDIPAASLIRSVLTEARERLLVTLSDYGDDRLEQIPETLKERGFTVRTVLDIIGWHEGHHQGQAHITWNLYRAAQTPR